MKCILLVMVVSMCLAAAPANFTREVIHDIEMELTPELIVNSTKRSLAIVEDYIPATVKEEIEGMLASPNEVQGLAEYARKSPNDLEELIEFYKKNLPLSASRLERIKLFFKQSFSRIGKAGQEFITDFLNKCKEAKVDDKYLETKVNIAKMVVDSFEKYNNLDNSVKESIASQFPEIGKLINNPGVQSSMMKLQSLKNKSDKEIFDAVQNADEALLALITLMI